MIEAEEAGLERAYRLARDEWDHRWTHMAAAIRNWRLAALLGLILAVVFGTGWVRQVERTHLVPYLVLETELGRLVALGRAEPLGELSERQVRAELARWIETARSITSDGEVQRRWIDRTWAFLSESGARVLASYYEEHNPYELGAERTVQVAVAAIHPLSAESWQVRWVETVRSRSGRLLGEEPWQAVLGIARRPPETLEAALRNPGGLWITHISWAPELGPNREE